jgi:hypothetical protein
VSADNVVELDLGSLATGDVIRVETTGSVKLVESVVGLADASVNFDVVKLGKTLYTKTTTDDDAITLYVFATSTTAGTVVIKGSLEYKQDDITITLPAEDVAGTIYEVDLTSFGLLIGRKTGVVPAEDGIIVTPGDTSTGLLLIARVA